MQTILGSNGQIGAELARALRRSFTEDIRLVSRTPRKLHADDQLHPADLLDAAQTLRAVEGSEVVYLTAGLPMDTARWEAQWPIIMQNVIQAAEAHGARLVFFDNTYMYPQTAAPQTEATAFAPAGAKGRVRAAIAQTLLEAIAQGRVEGLIGRAPEFYGPGATQSITNRLIIDPLWAGKRARLLVRDDTLRTLIFTPDASRAIATLGNAPDAYGKTWHLPADDARLTPRAFVALAAQVFGVTPRHVVLKPWQLRLAGLVDAAARDAAELLPRYGEDNLFLSDAFKRRFPDFRVTTLEEGLEAIRQERAEQRA